MKNYIKHDPWVIIEEGYQPELNQITESLMSLGNGRMGQRANFEEQYTGPSLQGSYIAGVYYPDKTRVGWWKIGYPEYFAKVLNSCNWIGIDVQVGDETLDVHQCQSINHFTRFLDMKTGLLQRSMEVVLKNGAHLIIESKRFVSMDELEAGFISYTIKSVDYDGPITITPLLDFDIQNQDSNYNEHFWKAGEASYNNGISYVSATTKKTGFHVGVASKTSITVDGEEIQSTSQQVDEMQVGERYVTDLQSGSTILIEKTSVVASTMYHKADKIAQHASSEIERLTKHRFDHHLANHAQQWQDIWSLCDIHIEGDVAAQQGIRFNIFQLYQTYTGDDARLNIGPKGFTGEKYGGSTYWDTEAYCLPFYLSTADAHVARNLLIYRYNQLDKAIENAEKLGFERGAALYPMVTMTGEECHNEWEITFEEIHRNGAIAYAIYDYIRYTGDADYLHEYGLEVLIAISRFWSQRVNWSEQKGQFVVLGVTGPNEYENNVNNNWYTNYIACWCMDYTKEALSLVSETHPQEYQRIIEKTRLTSEETEKWDYISSNMYFPEDEAMGIFLQQDNYLDKEQKLVSELEARHRPLNQNWSWDRILRSCFIKQADVLQGLYFFEDHFDEDIHRRNFEFYEPRTVHESSLSPCVHVILASKLGMHDKAYEMYLRTSRLDLDDYNNDTEDGCHITSMAGTWMSIVKGFGGLRIEDGLLTFKPTLPEQWSLLTFKVKHGVNLYQLSISGDGIEISNLEGGHAEVKVNEKLIQLNSNQTITLNPALV